MAPLGARRGAGIEKQLQHGIGKDHGAHVAAIGNQPRRHPEITLALHQGIANHGGEIGRAHV